MTFPHLKSPGLAVACVSTILACNAASNAGYGASYVDVGGRNTGIIFAVGNMLATMGGIISPLFGSWVVAYYGDWNLLFYTVAVVQMAAAVVYYQCI